MPERRIVQGGPADTVNYGLPRACRNAAVS
jgi:hypothetical protein